MGAIMRRKRKSVEAVLVRCPNWVGDIVMATPALDCLRENFPGARMIGLIRQKVRGVVEDGPWFDDIVDCEDKTWFGLRRTAKRIRAIKPDMAILLPNSIRSVLPIRLGSVKQIYGYRRSLRGLLLSGGPRPPFSGAKTTPIPTKDYYLEICRWLGLTLPAERRPRLFIGRHLQKRGDDLLQKYGIREQDRVVALNPGASFGSSKCWPAENFAVAAELFEREMQAKVLLLSGPGEEKIVNTIMTRTGAVIIDTCPDRVDLELLKPLVRRSNLLVTNDTGPRHYAVAFHVPVVVIMGPMDPRYSSTNLERTTVIRKQLDCSPCHRKTCPTDHRCMKDITPQMVFEAGRKLLKDQEQHETVVLSR
jgi:heptosyltransferase-2